MNKKNILKKYGMMVLAVYALAAVLVLVLAHHHIRYTPEQPCVIAENPEKDLGELVDGTSIVQTLSDTQKYLSGVEAYFLTYGRENQGSVRVEILDLSDESVAASSTCEVKSFGNGEWQSFELDHPVDVTQLKGQPGIRFVFENGTESNAVTMTTQAVSETDQELWVNGERQDGRALCIKVIEYADSQNAVWYPVILGVVFLLLAAFCAWNIREEKKGKITVALKLVLMLEKYQFLLEQLVSRDFKTKYKRSILGVFWSFLNPLLTMAVQYMVFSHLFKFQIPAYPVYLLTGVVLFNFFNEATTQAMGAITGNASLITKVYVPKYIYPISKVLSTSINLLFSLIPLFLVAWITGRGIHWVYLMLPFGIITFLAFVIGVAFFLATAMVYFRDTQFLWGVFTLLWMYATPIIYPISILEGTFLYHFQKINPLYYYITFFRTIIIDGVSPAPMAYLICIGFAVLALAIGGAVFKKAQDQFILHI